MCQREAHARGFCPKHYQRLKNHGSVVDPRPPFEERLWAKVEQRGTEDCWPWTGALTMHGYGVIAFEGSNSAAHRIMYEREVGPIPEGLVLDHTCHNADLSCPGGMDCPHRACVNPLHLEPVTNYENLRRSKAGRPWRRVAEHCPANPNAKS